MDRQKLKAHKREIFGRKIKSLRREGFLPANLYGKKIASLAIQLPVKDFLAIYEKAGETGLVDLTINGKVSPVLISNVQLNPVTDFPLHVDFRAVDLKEKIQAAVPVELTGGAPAEKTGVGILVQQLNEVEVEALPTDLPEKLIADVSKLENVDEVVLVKDLLVDKEKVSVVTDENQIIAKIEPPAKEEVAPAPAEEAVPAEGVPAEGGEERAPEGGEQPAEGREEKKEEE